MENHPSYPALQSLLRKYPKAAGSLFQTYNDLLLAQKWTSIELLDLSSCSRAAIKGQKPRVEPEPLRPPYIVVPCSLAESLSTSWLQAAFTHLDKLSDDKPASEIFLAMTSEDASIVYYKISRGIVKPPM
ncbi:hypothetical protein SERLA73DRAFT_156092 [Serpula lacrymans var. lacrymans S7.3]|uniref:tRNA-splicing endonuclease subunit Sen15 domain-containing protein n=1 Tax=Serpula lacrymans var. lacrymans (strain S7.3) TaxID=936435 RepID=F8QCW2_SERL3|nr:hypothetical protein SERLA73DRAFT_156092 [Serpula lacrymans var. lacrymans S7.3]